MKVLLINYEYPPVGGGASNATREIARALLKLGHTPTVLTAKYRNRLPDRKNPGIKIIQVPAIRRRLDRSNIFEMLSFMLTALWTVRRTAVREHIDGIIAFFSIPCGPVALWAWKDNHVPYIISLRGGDVPGKEAGLRHIHFLLRPLRHAVFRSAREIVANSLGLKTDAERADPYSVDVIPNGVDTDFWKPLTERPRKEVLQLVFVGRFHSQKNLPYLFKLLAKLPADAEFELNLVGDGPDAPKLRTLAHELKIERRLRWHGWQEREALREIYRSSHCLINPSKYEGMSNVLLESMACALPAIVSKIAGNEELIEPEKTGWFLPIDDFEQSVSLLSRLVKSREAMRQAGLLARELVLSRADWKEIAAVYVRKLNG